MAEHTPGPWRLKERRIRDRLIEIEVYGPEDCGRGWAPVAKMPAGFTNLREDMALIAAAPTMLEACRKALDAFGDEMITDSGLSKDDAQRLDAILHLTAAIAKATDSPVAW